MKTTTSIPGPKRRKQLTARRPAVQNEHLPHHRVDVVWVLLWVLLVIGFLATAGLFYAATNQTGGPMTHYSQAK